MAECEDAARPARRHPSRVRAVEEGRLGWTEVDLLDTEGGGGAVLRAALEQFGVRVNYFSVGQARHLVAALGGERRPAPYVIVACHGHEGTILLGELVEDLARLQPFRGAAGPAEIREYIRLPRSVVICTGCDTGRPGLAEAFLEAGASAYVAPEREPFGYAGVFAPLFLFYELTETRTLEEAVGRLRAHDGELEMWRLFRR